MPKFHVEFGNGLLHSDLVIETEKKAKEVYCKLAHILNLPQEPPDMKLYDRVAELRNNNFVAITRLGTFGDGGVSRLLWNRPGRQTIKVQKWL